MTNEDFFKPEFSGVRAGRSFRVSRTGVGTIEEQQVENLPLLLEPQKFQRASHVLESKLPAPVFGQWERMPDYFLVQKQRVLSDLQFAYERQNLPLSKASGSESVEIMAQMILDAVDAAVSEESQRLPLYGSLLVRLNKRVEEKEAEKHLEVATENYAYKQKLLEQIKLETAELVAAEAQARGISVDEYVISLLPETNGEKRLHMTATAEEWVRKFREWAASHPVLPVIADDSRESIYEGRGE